MILFCIQFFCKCGYRTARLEVAYSLFQIIVAPFGKVRFRDFFLADVLTSIPTSLNDFCIIVYFLQSGDFVNSLKPNSSQIKTLQISNLIVSFIPFWFRFAQCLHKLIENPQKNYM